MRFSVQDAYTILKIVTPVFFWSKNENCSFEDKISTSSIWPEDLQVMENTRSLNHAFHLKSSHRNVSSSQSLISDSLARSFGRLCVLDLSRKRGLFLVNWVLKAFPATKQNSLDWEDCELSFHVQFAHVYIETSLQFLLVFDAPLVLQCPPWRIRCFVEKLSASEDSIFSFTTKELS